MNALHRNEETLELEFEETDEEDESPADFKKSAKISTLNLSPSP